MSIGWVFVRNEEEVLAAEREQLCAEGEFGMSENFPAFGFMHSDFAEEHCMEWQTESQLLEKIKKIQQANHE